MAGKEWSFFFPEDGQSLNNATTIVGKIWDAEDAAREAVEYDYRSRDGWKRGESEFEIVVISPEGAQTRFIGWNEPTVTHSVREAQ